jgi:hypothetical protein
MDLKEQLISQILFHLHTLFELPSSNGTSASMAVRDALEQMYSVEDSCGRDGPFDAHAYGLTLFRKIWHGGTEAEDPASLVSGISHLEHASFFSKTGQEIARWAKRFLMIERYYRLDARESENRLDRYRALRSLTTQSLAPVIHHFEDLLIWLEYRQLESTHLTEHALGPLSRKISKELEGLLAADVLMGDPLQPTIYVLLACHQYCQSEILGQKEEKRLEKLFATRQLDSLLDLMRVVLHKTTRNHRLPEARVILDELRKEKFNISHHGFRDPYEADLVPLEDTERMETAQLPLFIPLGMLTGEYGRDLAMSRRMLMEWHDRVINHIIEDCEAYTTATVQPMPRADLLYKSIRFAVSWALAKSSWPIQDPRDSLEQGAKDLLPEPAVKMLVRPRKGYEMKSRQELNRLIAGEVRRRRKALERVALSRSIQGYYDYAQFIRYVTFQHLREKYADALGTELENIGGEIAETVTIDWVRDMGKKWSVEAHLVHPQSLEPVQQYLRTAVPPELIAPDLEKSFATTHGELEEIYQQILDQSTPVFFRLLVAYGRNRAGLPRLSATVDDIPEMLVLLAPPLHKIQEISSRSIKQDFVSGAAPLYRSQLRPYLLDGSEWEAYLAWHVKTYIENLNGNGDPESARFLEVGDLDGLLGHLEHVAREVDLPPNALFTETTLSTLLGIIQPRDDGDAIPDAKIHEVVALLPQVDCGACGQPACRDFARSLLAGRIDPGHCLQLSPDRVPALMEAVKGEREGADMAPAHSPGMLELLSHRHLWRSSPGKSVLQRVLSVRTQKTRRLFVDRVKQIWHGLSPKPGIFKYPDPEVFYQDLHRYVGHEASERLREDERRFLTANGELRQTAEWHLLKARQDWLTLANKNRRSRPLLQGQDAEWVARESYDNVFFLHQLGKNDRELLLKYRLEQHQDGFSHWWNEDLLTMNHPDFIIRDWEDFSRIIKNAYWHQEDSLSVEDALSVLEGLLLSEKGSTRAMDDLLGHWIHCEAGKLASEREHYLSLQKEPGREELKDIVQLRAIVGCLIDEMGLVDKPAQIGKASLFGSEIPTADRVALSVMEAWERFQEAGFIFSPLFSCRWDELLPGEKEAFDQQLKQSRPTDQSRSTQSKSSTSGGGWVLSDWKGPLHTRVAFIRAVMTDALTSRYREAAEWEYVRKAKDKAALPQGSFRLIVRRLLRSGASSEQAAKEMKDTITPHRDLQHHLLREMLRSMIHGRQYERLCRFNDSTPAPSYNLSEHRDFFSKAFPELEKSLEGLLERHKTLDRERLLHYLFLLAKMEGNLDTLTALLREIRETSDIIEAAWLRFTEERLVEGPGSKLAPSIPAGVPILASRLKEKEPVNRGLNEGVSRREKKNVASAVAELLNIIRFHILLSMERHPDRDNGAQSVLEDIQRAGYDFSGIDEEALKRAVEREWGRRERLEGRKIWIYTTVTARRLAAQHAGLHEAEREFYKIRLDVLKEDSGDDGPHQGVAGRRGVALGQVKEEMYRQLSDLLEPERIATFQNRIRQIVAQLDQKREEIYRGWLEGDINRRTVFYVLRQCQKDERGPTWSDFERFLRDHWLLPLAELRASQRPDRDERIRNLDDRFRALLGASLLEIESAAAADADQDFQRWMDGQLERLEPCVNTRSA